MTILSDRHFKMLFDETLALMFKREAKISPKSEDEHSDSLHLSDVLKATWNRCTYPTISVTWLELSYFKWKFPFQTSGNRVIKKHLFTILEILYFLKKRLVFSGFSKAQSSNFRNVLGFLKNSQLVSNKTLYGSFLWRNNFILFSYKFLLVVLNTRRGVKGH